MPTILLLVEQLFGWTMSTEVNNSESEETGSADLAPKSFRRSLPWAGAVARPQQRHCGSCDAPPLFTIQVSGHLPCAIVSCLISS